MPLIFSHLSYSPVIPNLSELGKLLLGPDLCMVNQLLALDMFIPVKRGVLVLTYPHEHLSFWQCGGE